MHRAQGTACQEGTRRESKQINRYIDRGCKSRFIDDILGYFMIAELDFVGIGRDRLCNTAPRYNATYNK